MRFGAFFSSFLNPNYLNNSYSNHLALNHRETIMCYFMFLCDETLVSCCIVLSIKYWKHCMTHNLENADCIRSSPYMSCPFSISGFVMLWASPRLVVKPNIVTSDSCTILVHLNAHFNNIEMSEYQNYVIPLCIFSFYVISHYFQRSTQTIQTHGNRWTKGHSRSHILTHLPLANDFFNKGEMQKKV